MSSELYKKYRPRSLSRIVGNEATVQSLEKMLKAKKLPHTILFSGPSGCGKTTLARILRKEIGCSEADYRELNCSQNRGIETIRDIQSIMTLAPMGGPVRVWTLDEAQLLTSEAQHAALKMLEDTPAHVYFFLCTTHAPKLLPAIRTRCTDMPVSPLSDESVLSLMKRVLKKEGITAVSKDVAMEIVEAAGGSARKALVILDKIAHLPPEDQEKAVKKAQEEEREAIELCRALIKKASWSEVGKILKTIKGEPESIRWAVLGYARQVLLSGKNPQAYVVLCAFEGNFFDSKEAGLARASYEAIFG